MWSNLFEDLIYSAHDAFRILVPHPHERTPITNKHIPYAIIPFIPFVYMAYLARRPGTYVVRLLLLPLVLVVTLGTSYRFMWTEPRLNVYNWGQCLLAEALAAKAVHYALTREGMLRVGESSPGIRPTVTAPKTSDGQTNGSASHGSKTTSPQISQSCFYDTSELILSMRGLGWKYGVGVHVPKEHKSLERALFLKSTVLSFLQNFLILDFLESMIKLVPGVGTPEGRSIFFHDLPITQRFLLSTAIHVATGSCLLYGFQMIYDLITIIAVGLLQSPPSAWPPIMDHPWSSDSLHIFWAKRWHQVLRQTFIICGGYPGELLGGNFGMVIGTFIGSGLYHEFAIYAMGSGFDYRVPFFFAVQGPLLMFERVWRKVIGRRIGGVYGILWVYFCIIILGQPLVDSWHRRGLGGGMVIPPPLSPARLLFIPFFRDLIEKYIQTLA
ncbi:hypothetical protein SERLA73DRAFT_183248 [Serpula lacrymans var. lacrymans S7.3]|uniref:Wax synthase domain-containing protein n=2 Tax=Serpula lacrymans var. lacrymans TaxID=341189 RepID=F8PZI5_SERL3|nr:uncharacterized protein SERLADRAFT_470304 [Serpula lacrymans var. lacrymans S7.9]EGN98307.1 hypothetical protein SERLA73DRAFT_183248 [Serpula lacrymans var. lacrymans S7.3]EGO23874.1 hypothetical protein SERLADRAFT_470304 [Serpula lacrymans var. lacrymans S7.9]